MTGCSPEVNRVLECGCDHYGQEFEHSSAKVLSWHFISPRPCSTGWMLGIRKRILNPDLLHDALKVRWMKKNARRYSLEVFRRYVPEGKSPMCGNTIGQDRRFMARWIPGMERYFHYRSIDVSTIKELCRRWAPEKVWVGTCVNKHQALADIAESIHELSWYRQEVFRI